MEERDHRDMPVERKFAEGALNIARFNWPFFAWAGIAAIILFVITLSASSWIAVAALILLALLIIGILVPLLVSFYVYDLSTLYQLPFLKKSSPQNILNLTAGFDETTPILQDKFPNARIQTLDFYQKETHTEPSIKRARKLFPAQPGTLSISTSQIPLPDGETDLIIAFFSLHEIRNASERSIFLTEAKRILTPQGKIIIVEHLRNLPNFIAYSVGFLHFHSLSTWRQSFIKAKLKPACESNLTPFIKIFELTRP